VLVHAGCPATSGHVHASGGGYAFNDYEQFCTIMQQLLNEPAQADALGQRGYEYVEQQYSWDTITRRVVEGIAECTGPHNRFTRLTQRGIRRALAFTPKRFHDAFLHLVEQARIQAGGHISPQQHEALDQAARVGTAGYQVRSSLPGVGRLVAWARQQLTAHLREPYLDPIVARQEQFNAELLRTLLPVLKQRLYEQRHLRQEIERLRARLEE
jgi:hypothetical protein